MFKKIFILYLFTFLFSSEIQNIQVSQRTDGSKIIELNYDLIDDTFPSFTISVELSIDGENFEPYSLDLMSGDVGENVIPGIGKSIEIQAPDNIYSDNVIAKIIASAYMVTSELPFTMIAISSSEGVSAYQGQTINYNFEIMQSELTNADLVTFLETYEFNLNESSEPLYDCNNYTDYFNSGSGDNEQVHGCMDSNALNYNPDANYDDDYCIWQGEVGCTDSNAFNYDSDYPQYDDCSCLYLQVENSEPVGNYCDFSCLENEGSLNENASNGAPDQCEWDGMYWDSLELNSFQKNTFSGCGDPNAINYIGQDFLTACGNMESQWMDYSCCAFENNPNSCIYECDESYLNQDYGSVDFGFENIENFSTQSISFQGSSFVIESGAGTQPALLDYNNCVDGIIVSLLLDYYGLRIPNGEEWIKASRQDNDRCWPWMSETCSVAQQNHCESLFTCQTEEEFDTCTENADALNLSCQQSCNDDMSSCSNACNSNNNPSSDCSLLQNEYDCDQNSNCDWQSESCMDTCTVCIDQGNYWDVCGDPSNVSCPCYNECNFNNDNNNDCFNECNDEMFTCMNDCGNNYGNSYEYCNHQEMMDCENNLQDCTDNSQGCEEIDSNSLSDIIDGTNNPDETNYDEHGFLTYVYSNKFNLIFEQNYENGNIINVQDVAQYPEGISAFGLYDVIGNAPELVKFNNKYWLIGLYPSQDRAVSFCTDSIFDEYNDSQGHPINNTDAKKYGLRLIRTTTSE